ncbi:hypothetical protein K438DRAFT_1749707 [Mycena galopus ATCC 62051]|nr:hypothetical protein K438DRAFT_1749707 [Mycena galopus ATCC 62051]
MSTVQHTVIAIPELLEIILAQLPMRDLLVAAPLVSKTWQMTTLSPTLQCALFFLPDPSSRLVLNPLLVEIFPPFFAKGEGIGWSWPGNVSSIKSMPWSKAPHAFRRPEASWRRMLAAQPPVQTMVVTETVRGVDADVICTRRAVKKISSLYMGVLYDLAFLYAERQSANFCMRWPGHNGVDPECDLTLAVFTPPDDGHSSRPSKSFRRWFQSDDRKEMKLKFGKWKVVKVY